MAPTNILWVLKNYFISCYRFKERVALNRPESPCNGDGDSESKALRDNIARGYLHGETECQNFNDIPCMIPQVQDLLTSDEKKSLHPCSTLLQYNCMKQRLLYSFKHSIETVKKCITRGVSVDVETFGLSAAVRYTHHCTYIYYLP